MDEYLPGGIESSFLGPPGEWILACPTLWMLSRMAFWDIVSDLMVHEGGRDADYDDLPDWMTEIATELLKSNTN